MANKQTVLVTGATSGIGLSIASSLHAAGFTVFGTSRNPAACKGKVPFELLPLDVTSAASATDCINLLLTKTPVLDVLVNNAGVFLTGGIEETSIEQARRHFDTNFWGAVNVTKAVLPVMRRQKSGKIITTGSLVGLIGIPFSAYYSAGKHALEGFFKSLRFEVRQFNIHVSTLEPGFFKTNIDAASESAPVTIPEYDELRGRALKYATDSIAAAPAPTPVADTVLQIIHSKKPKYSYPVGRNTKLLPALQLLAPGMFETGFIKALNL